MKNYRADVRAKAERALMLAVLGGSVLAGEDPEVQGAALAEMMATFLRGHRIVDGSADENEMRETMLTQWLKTVRELLLLHSQPCGGPPQ